jgi:hypothetical protein
MAAFNEKIQEVGISKLRSHVRHPTATLLPPALSRSSTALGCCCRSMR